MVAKLTFETLKSQISRGVPPPPPPVHKNEWRLVCAAKRHLETDQVMFSFIPTMGYLF